MFLPIFHLFVVALNSFTFWYDQVYLDIPFPAPGYAEMWFKARYMFLTLWCLTLYTLYFFVSFLNDFIGTNEAAPRKAPFIRQLKDIMFAFAFPTTIYVSTCFWTLYVYDRQLIFPDFVMAIVPFWANHVIHTFGSVFMLIEAVSNKFTYPQRNVGLTLLAAFNFTYLIWAHYLYYRTGAWPYPLLEVISLTERAVFIGVGMIAGYAYYVLGEKLAALHENQTCKLNGVNGVNGIHKKNY